MIVALSKHRVLAEFIVIPETINWVWKRENSSNLCLLFRKNITQYSWELFLF